MLKKIYKHLNFIALVVIPIILILISVAYSVHSDNVEKIKIVEKQRQIKFKNDSLKIVRDSLQKIYMNSQQYADSINIRTKFLSEYKDHIWTINDVIFDTTRKKEIIPHLIIRNINDSVIKCGDTYNSCEQFKKIYCKNQTKTLLDKVMDKNNYSEYKNCLEIVNIDVAFDTTYKFVYDTFIVKKEITLSDVKVRYFKLSLDSVNRFFVELKYKNNPKYFEYKNNNFYNITFLKPPRLDD